jgi:DNA-entry nuclease
MNYKNIVEKLVNDGANNIRKKTVVLNNNKPIFKKTDFEVIEGVPKYFGVDKYGRIIGAIALISKNTIPKITEKELEYPRPYGWTKNLEKIKGVFESCHIIAYNLSAQSTNKENLFIGTNDLNTSIMKKIENTVNEYIKKHDVNVLYKVTMEYREKDQIPTGILIEAKSLDDEFSVCVFCYNIERYIKFDYKDGTIIYNHNYLDKAKETFGKLKNKIVQKNKSKEKKKQTIGERKNYVLNININECHYNRDCEKLKHIEPKYIQGTRTTQQIILDNGFKFCSKCK